MDDFDKLLIQLVSHTVEAIQISEKLPIQPTKPKQPHTEPLSATLQSIHAKSSKILANLVNEVLDRDIADLSELQRGQFHSVEKHLFEESIQICHDMAKKNLNRIKNNKNPNGASDSKKAISTQTAFEDKTLFISYSGRPFGGKRLSRGSLDDFRPQDGFKFKLDNSAHVTFRPFLKTKPNALLDVTPLEIEPNKEYEHPYKREIDFHFKKFLSNEGVNIAEKYADSKPLPLEKTPCHWVDTKESLLKMLKTLRKTSEFAVDIENHDFRSYLGFVCLIQISTAAEDFLIDAIALHDELQRLNEVMTDSKILKVFHDAEGDVLWLQRDFSVYIVNLFDTGKASYYLKNESTSLAFLLKKYCGEKKSSEFQRSDWRIRPLSKGQVNYARGDTHFLLFIKDCLRNALIEKSLDSGGKQDLLADTIMSSNLICLKKFTKPVFGQNVMKKYISRFFFKDKKDPLRRAIFYRLFQWRDQKARVHDESWSKIISNPNLSKVIDRLPETIKQARKLIQSNSLYTHKYRDEVFHIYRKACEDFHKNPDFSAQFIVAPKKQPKEKKPKPKGPKRKKPKKTLMEKLQTAISAETFRSLQEGTKTLSAANLPNKNSPPEKQKRPLKPAQSPKKTRQSPPAGQFQKSLESAQKLQKSPKTASKVIVVEEEKGLLSNARRRKGRADCIVIDEPPREGKAAVAFAEIAFRSQIDGKSRGTARRPGSAAQPRSAVAQRLCAGGKSLFDIVDGGDLLK